MRPVNLNYCIPLIFLVSLSASAYDYKQKSNTSGSSGAAGPVEVTVRRLHDDSQAIKTKKAANSPAEMSEEERKKICGDISNCDPFKAGGANGAGGGVGSGSGSNGSSLGQNSDSSFSSTENSKNDSAFGSQSDFSYGKSNSSGSSKSLSSGSSFGGESGSERLINGNELESAKSYDYNQKNSRYGSGSKGSSSTVSTTSGTNPTGPIQINANPNQAVNESAGSSAASTLGGTGQNVVAAQDLYKKSKGGKPSVFCFFPILCARSKAANNQAANMMGVMLAAELTALQSQFEAARLARANAPLVPDTSGDPNDPFAGAPRELDKRIRFIDKKLSESGFTTSANGKEITLPNGTKIPISALSNPDGLAKYGASAQEIALMKQMDAENAAKYKAMLAGAGDSTSGAGSAGSAKNILANAAAAGFDMDKFLEDDGKGRDRGPAGLAGMGVRYGSDLIGLSRDNIFQMVSRQYQHQDGLKQFYKD